ncbi:uncharacterized protein EAE97_007460 [Botrytis byssoidea]|uniref:Homeobox domain-containing protein n=1 Tax=Botrytis byssoidea TaxID=139641 RepID=A0A9P5ILV4_9HELO|nr:uncharacterized protein EAE97_007460 [Botrytis byssoidea]KAF7939380.1 hypothetical protein EAE97_007460 [Botrytis byssoidea]
MPKDAQHIVFLDNYYRSLPNPDILMEPTKQTAIRCNAAHIPPTTPGVDGVDSQIVGRHISECRRRARHQPRAERLLPWQVAILEAAYLNNHYPSAGERMILMDDTRQSYRKIKNWFEQKAKMLKKAGGGPAGPNPGSNKYSTKMWKAYYEDPVGYVRKLRNGEIDLVTGAAIGQAAINLSNAPASGPINNTSEDTGLAALGPSANIDSAPYYQPKHQHGQGDLPGMQSQPYDQMIQLGQYDYSNMQAPPQSPIPKQGQYGLHSMPVYTRDQDEIYSMPPPQPMNSGIGSYAGGRSYEVSRVQPASQQTAYTGVYAVDDNQAVPGQYGYGMPANSQSGIPYDPFAVQNDGELDYQGQNRYEPIYPSVPRNYAVQYMPAYPQVPESPAGQLLGETFTQSQNPARKRKLIPEDDEINQGPHSTHLRKRPRQASNSRLSALSESPMFAGADARMRVTKEPVKRLGASRLAPKTHQRPTAGESGIRRTSGSGTDDSINSSFDGSGIGERWTPHPHSRLNICHSSPYERETAEEGETSPNIRAPNIRTPEVRDADSEGRDSPLLFGPEQSGPSNDIEAGSGQRFVASEPPIPESVSKMTQGVAHTQQHAATNIPDPVAQHYDAARARVPSPAIYNTTGGLNGSWEANVGVQGLHPQEYSAFSQEEAHDLEPSGQVSPENTLDVQDNENFEDLLAAPEMHALEQTFLHNGEFDYSAFLGNDGLFEDWNSPNLDVNN